MYNYSGFRFQTDCGFSTEEQRRIFVLFLKLFYILSERYSCYFTLINTFPLRNSVRNQLQHNCNYIFVIFSVNQHL